MAKFQDIAQRETILLAIEAVKRNNRQIKNSSTGRKNYTLLNKKSLINQNMNILAKLESLL